MTKFEEEFKALTSWDWVNVDLIQQILTRFGNWHSDEEFQELLDKYSNLNDNYEKEVIKSSKLETSNLKLIAEGTGLLSDNAMLTKKVEDLKSQLQQQALPVVPECVAKVVELLKKNPETPWSKLYEALGEEGVTCLNDFQHKDERFGFGGLNSKLFVLFHLAINGYQVEKAQLFRLKLKNATISNYYLWLNQATGKVFVDKKFLDWTNHDNVKNIFTEQEIAKISDGAFVNNEAFELVP
ncbi:DUF1642 domain-containing protein [Lactococcus lactis]|nr:DUF1642 domain-containing protein [Lactococcus lactis]